MLSSPPPSTPTSKENKNIFSLSQKPDEEHKELIVYSKKYGGTRGRMLIGLVSL